ncbi:MAG: hypothetical protein V8R49_01220 [Duodenibacillus massiliensis]
MTARFRPETSLLRAGRNTMTADGSVAVAGKGALNLKARIAAPDLSEVLPQLKGGARGTVAVSGTLGEPRLSADLTASGMRFNDLAIDRARLAGRFGYRGCGRRRDAYGKRPTAGRLRGP